MKWEREEVYSELKGTRQDGTVVADLSDLIQQDIFRLKKRENRNRARVIHQRDRRGRFVTN